MTFPPDVKTLRRSDSPRPFRPAELAAKSLDVCVCYQYEQGGCRAVTFSL